MVVGIGVQGLGVRDWGSGIVVQGLGLRVDLAGRLQAWAIEMHCDDAAVRIVA